MKTKFSSEKAFTCYAIITASMPKKKKEEKYKFVVPEFDEKEYILKEIVDTKRALLVLVYGILLGGISFLLGKLNFNLALAVGLLAGIGLRFVFLGAKIDLSKLEKKTWLATGFMYIITWLAFWTLFANL